jgi:hypothetical protein
MSLSDFVIAYFVELGIPAAALVVIVGLTFSRKP